MLQNVAKMINSAFGLTTIARRSIASSSAVLAGKHRAAAKPKDDDDTFELLPPGASIADPIYGLNEDTTVINYDEPPAAEGVRQSKPVPKTPRNVEAAQKKLKQKEVDDNEPYVYLPPGSSMKEPGYNSMSDPIDKVYYRDPTPILKKK